MKEVLKSKTLVGWAIYCDENDVRFVTKLRAFSSANKTIVCPAELHLNVSDEVTEETFKKK